jgi:hypothetical protein
MEVRHYLEVPLSHVGIVKCAETQSLAPIPAMMLLWNKSSPGGVESEQKQRRDCPQCELSTTPAYGANPQYNKLCYHLSFGIRLAYIEIQPGLGSG